MAEEEQISIYDLLDKDEKPKKAASKKRKKSSGKKRGGYGYKGGGRSEWVSVFYKALRIGDVEVIFKAYMILTEKLGVKNSYILKKLQGCLAEDGAPDEQVRLQPYLNIISQKNKVGDAGIHDIWHAIYQVVKAKKWYMTREGREWMEMRLMRAAETAEENELADDGWGEIYLPSYALDAHSKKGRMLKKKGVKTDERLCGHAKFRNQLLKMWLKLEEEHSDKTLEELREIWVEKFREVPEGAYDPKSREDTTDWEPDIEKVDTHLYEIESQSQSDKKYVVNLSRETCTCPYYEKREQICKHIRKVREQEE